MRSVCLFCLLVSFSSALPLPQLLTEEQFRGFLDDSSSKDINDVQVVSGYAKVARFGRGFNNHPVGLGQLRVRTPAELPSSNSIFSFDDVKEERAPMFIPETEEEKKLKEEETNEILEKIKDLAETIIEEQEDDEEAEITTATADQSEVVTTERQSSATVTDADVAAETTVPSFIEDLIDIIATEDELELQDAEKAATELQPSVDVDLGSVQEI